MGKSNLVEMSNELDLSEMLISPDSINFLATSLAISIVSAIVLPCATNP